MNLKSTRAGARLAPPALALSILLAGLVALPVPAGADDLTAADIVRSLKVAKKPRTRSLGKQEGGAPSYSAEEQSLIRSLPTRGLKVAMKQEIGQIIDDRKPPRLDIEIQFEFNSDAITASSIPDLNALGAALIDPSLEHARIILNGHTDAKGSNDYNLDLSERRAVAVQHYLISHFPIKDGRLIAIGFGEERLRNSHDPDAAENRRVEIVNMGS
ncbi:OmpA family protein [Hoeflea marina]|uniref:OmpA family protein n=1 Tax=Hoeflea marina TaxID=274592 RepID=A0A317PRE9_9HYPH|nr:OmpA family protein [Hoeflea marina]PWW01454.1 OmpA family protein [Hoeflea marina]